MRLLAQIGQLNTCGVERVVFRTEVVFVLEQQVQRQARDAGLNLVVQDEIRVEELRPEVCLASGIGEGRIGHAIGTESTWRGRGQSRTTCATGTFPGTGLYRKGAGLEDRVGI